jgi:hypothetical protein
VHVQVRTLPMGIVCTLYQNCCGGPLRILNQTVPTHIVSLQLSTTALLLNPFSHHVSVTCWSQYCTPYLQSQSHDGNDHVKKDTQKEELFLGRGASTLPKFFSLLTRPHQQEWLACDCILGQNMEVLQSKLSHWR